MALVVINDKDINIRIVSFISSSEGFTVVAAALMV